MALFSTAPKRKRSRKFAIDRDLIVMADEAYEDLVYDDEHVSIASLPEMYERTITSFTLSKSYSMTGWRVGYVAAKEPWMTGLRKATLYSTNGVSTPSQWAGLAAVETPVGVLKIFARATGSAATCSSMD